MIHLATIIGARPQFIKASVVSKTIREHFSDRINETIIHSGQHYDEFMSAIFFRELELPQPAFHLGAGSASAGMQTGKIITEAEKALEKIRPDACLVYGDTNTTIAAAIAASKLKIPVIHVEAGLRSFNKNEPEEINRILTDHASTLLCCPTQTSVDHLLKEGFNSDISAKAGTNNPLVFLSGDVMFDLFLQKIKSKLPLVSDIANIPADLPFIVATLHRAGNTDDATVLNSLLESISSIAEQNRLMTLIPLHPRTKKAIENFADPQTAKYFNENKYIKILQPLSYLEMLSLLQKCKLVMTDAGGVQKEAYFSGKPCLILRNETEWTELTDHKFAWLAGTSKKGINEAFEKASNTVVNTQLNLYGDGNAGRKICDMIVNQFA